MAVKPTEIDKAMAEALRQFRVDLGFSQPRVARKLGISYQSYQKMEYGQVAFRVQHIPQLADALDIDVESLLEAILGAIRGRETT